MLRRFLPIVLLLALVIAVVPATVSAQEECAELTPVSVQLKWVPQAQFAGYYAAEANGFWEDECLDVTIIPAGPDIAVPQVIAAGGADFGIEWLNSFLATRDAGQNVVNIAQIYQRAGLRQLTWADSGLETIADLEGKVVGVWGAGNQYPLFAALTAEGIDPENPDDVTIFNQPFDMNAFLNREIDSAAAMTYNELAQVLEFVGEDGEFPVYTMEDLNVIDLNEVGTAVLEDGIFVTEEWLAEEGNEEVAVAFLKGTFRGWAYCRDNPDDCVQYVLEAGSTLGEGHQAWMMNEVNKLIWPSEMGIGIMDPALFAQGAEIANTYGITEELIGEEAFRTDLAEQALSELMEEYPDLDLMGMDYEPAEVEVTPNGE